MNDGSIEEALVLELPLPLVDGELGMEFDLELDEPSESSETVGLDDGVVLDLGADEIDAGDELSWLDAGEESEDLDVGSELHEGGEGWLDDKPMPLDLGFLPETSEESASLDQGAEGLDEPQPQAGRSGDDDQVDLPAMPVVSDDDADLDPSDF